MSKRERAPEMPQILNTEAIKVVAENAEMLKGVLNSGDEAAALNGNWCTTCCCPKFLKFKFVLCNVWIENENAACSGTDSE
ncbi:hypothetical protein [Candidatus Formimonas warabiya]|uniref:Uncharacterized protein n=1 Tax=Formimonas warabiya TaxID=1761012 RepID=A0A3G1KPL3_FORW1|nr:hypothetical protein [Candidatus Formimonas warabiya]ATW24387.1 hypothetical protein DCMF_05945 [Candidatus Formimonas warabiya]